MADSAIIDLTKLEILDLVSMAKGGKTAAMGYGAQGKAFWQATDMEVVFEPGTFSGEEASRVNLVARPGPEARAQLEALDEWLVPLLSKHSDRLMGKYMTHSEIKAIYIPALKASKQYEPTVKFKLNLTGEQAVRVWGSDKALRDQPQKWRGLRATLRVHLKGIYIMNRSLGCILDVTDVMVDGDGAERAQICPFA